MDARRDHGEYYPGGGTRQGTPSAPGGGADASGKVDRVDLGVIADDASASEMRTAIQRIQRAMRPAATGIAVLCGVWAAEARTNAWDELRGGAAVVVEEEDAAALAEIAAATNALAARIADATNGVVAALPPQQDLEPYATKAALAAATNAVMAAMPAAANLEGYATKAWIGQQGFVTDAFLGTNFATKAWVNALGFVNQTALDAFEGTVEARVGVVENAVAGSTNGLASKAWVEGKGYVTASVTNGLAKRAWVTDRNYATEAWVTNKQYVTKSVTNGLASMQWTQNQGYVTKSVTNGLATKTWVTDRNYASKSYSDANRDAAKSYARSLAYAAEIGNTRLVTEDGRTWQDATGTVWKVTDVWGWVGTAWTNNVSLPVKFYPEGSGTNFVSNIAGMRHLVTDGGDVPYMYLREADNPSLSQMADAMGKATDTNLTWNSISPLLGEMSGRIELSKAVVALETNAVRHVAYTDTQGGGGNASSAEEAQRLVTPDGTQWTDATGYVWRVATSVVKRYSPWQWEGAYTTIFRVEWQNGWRIFIEGDATPILSTDPNETQLSADANPVPEGYGLGQSWRAWREVEGEDTVLVTNLVGRVALTNEIMPRAEIEARFDSVDRPYSMIYDQELGVTWRAVMRSGNLYYVAVTNVDLTAE